jgi:hypothetical protein
MYRFDSQQRLKPFAVKQNTFLTKLMLRRNILTENDTIGQHIPMTISGDAKFFLKQNPTTNETDSISGDEVEF